AWIGTATCESSHCTMADQRHKWGMSRRWANDAPQGRSYSSQNQKSKQSLLAVSWVLVTCKELYIMNQEQSSILLPLAKGGVRGGSAKRFVLEVDRTTPCPSFAKEGNNA